MDDPTVLEVGEREKREKRKEKEKRGKGGIFF